MARKPAGPKAAALGAELRAIRNRLGRSMLDVAGNLGWSESVVSRLETGNRNIDVEEVSALLAIYGVTGVERDRLMTMARTPDESSWLDLGLPGMTAEGVKLATYEAEATRITDWSPLLVPGLLQTMEYTRAFMLADGIPESDVGSRLMGRQRRQEVLGRVEYTAYIDESVMNRLIGDPRVMRGQVQRLIEIAEETPGRVRITPGNVDGHAGLAGPFVLLEYAVARPIVHVELARSGVFMTGEHDTEVYVATVGHLDAISLDAKESLRLLRRAAGAIGEHDGERELA